MNQHPYQNYCAFLMLALIALFWPVKAQQPLSLSVEKNDNTFIVNATSKLPVPLEIAWEVLTDFDHMDTILHNIDSSKITNKKGNTWIILQEGTVRFGIFSYSYISEREVRLDPMKRIISKQISGNARRYESVMELSRNNTDSQAKYYAEIILEEGIASTFGGSFIRHEIEEEFNAFYEEMLRRANQKTNKASRN